MLKLGGKLHGRYTIEALLGEGGMGAVYRGFDTLFDRKVAIKESRLGNLPSIDEIKQVDDQTILHGSKPSILTREKALERFEREAKLLSGLRHANLPEIYDFFTLDFEGYIAMSFIEGRNFVQLVSDNKGPPAIETVQKYLDQIMNTLEFCHKKGVIHRDIKPSNLLVTPRGKVFLVDFGIAKPTSLVSAATTTGARAFSPGYSPPEQYSGKGGTDARSDIFSLGAVIYFLLTGRDPIDALDQIAGEKLPAPSLINPGVSPTLDTFIFTCMSLNKNERYADITVARTALLEKGSGAGSDRISSSPVSTTRSRKEATSAPPIPLPLPPSKPVTIPEKPGVTTSRKTSTTRGGAKLVDPQQNEMTIHLAPEIEMVFIRIPAGPFWMGTNDPKRRGEQPLHKVTLDEFWIGKYPVTYRQYLLFDNLPGMKTTSSYFPPQMNDYAIGNISFVDAQRFCDWLAKKSKLKVRLPTEAEWEKSARGTDKRLYPWGDEGPRRNFKFALMREFLLPVGSFPRAASPYGVLDMVGYMWEWVQDGYEADFYKNSPAQNPVCSKKYLRNRVLRGGNSLKRPTDLYCFRRNYNSPSVANEDYGFRCALTV